MAARQLMQAALSFVSVALSSTQVTNVGIGKDHTLFATAEGVVQFVQKGPQNRKYAEVVSA